MQGTTVQPFSASEISEDASNSNSSPAAPNLTDRQRDRSPDPRRMDKAKPNAELKIGLFGIGLEAYWAQFPGLEDRLKGYGDQVAKRLERPAVQVVNLGLIDTT